MISTEVEARATLPTYMTYPDTWRTKQQPPEFLRPAPKPLTQLRYNGISSSLINGLTSSTHHTSLQQQQQQSSPTISSGGRAAPPCLPLPQTNLPPTPSPSPSTPTTPSSANSLRNSSKYSPPILIGSTVSQCSSRSNSSSPVNLSATHKLLGDESAVQVQMPTDDMQYRAYRIFAPSFVPSPYHASPYTVYAAAAAAASSPYALLPPHHPAAPRTAPYIPTATVAPPLSAALDSTIYNSLTSAIGTYLSPNQNSHAQQLKDSVHPLAAIHQQPQIPPSGPGGSITSGTSAKASGAVNNAGSITSGTSLLRERRPLVSSHFKIPSGKEGSLKHRILQTRPDERGEQGHVLDLQQKNTGDAMRGDGSNITRKRMCATLSPPPPTLAPPPIISLPSKQLLPLNNVTSQRHIPYPIQPNAHAHLSLSQPNQKHLHQHMYSSSASPPTSSSLPPPPGSNGVKQTPLITGGSFTRGTFIQLGGGELKRVEDMRTEDFVQSAERTPGLRLAESTVVKIAENRTTGGATVTLSYNERRTEVTQIEVESSWEHPYFVMGAGWASCKPELTYQYYGLRVSRLQVGDVLVSLTPREPVSPGLPTTQPSATTLKRERDRQSVTPPSHNLVNSSNVNSFNSHFRSPNSSITTQNSYIPYSAYQQQNMLLLRNGPSSAPVTVVQQQLHPNSCVTSSVPGVGNTTITTATGTAMASRPMTYAHPHALVLRSPHAQHVHAPAHHQLPVAVVPAASSCMSGSRNSRSMSPDSLARKRRWSVPDQLSDDEQQPVNRRSKTE